MPQPTTTIRVSAATYQQLAALAETLHAPISEVTAQATQLLRDTVFWEQAHVGYTALRADAPTAAAFDAEHALWAALPDGLERP